LYPVVRWPVWRRPLIGLTLCSSEAVVGDDATEIDRLLQETVARLASAKGDEGRVAQAIRQYLSEGSSLHMSPTELWDYFAISTPGLPEEAGFDAAETERAVEVFSMLADEAFRGR